MCVLQCLFCFVTVGICKKKYWGEQTIIIIVIIINAILCQISCLLHCN